MFLTMEERTKFNENDAFSSVALNRTLVVICTSTAAIFKNLDHMGISIWLDFMGISIWLIFLEADGNLDTDR